MTVTSWDCRPVSDTATLEKIVDLEIDVWGLSPRDAVPTSILHAMSRNGSLVVGAYDGTKLVGMTFAFPVRRGNQWMLWSHMTGTHPEYQKKGIGFALKQSQRTLALEHGYNKIGWTFDPLQRGNANFNLHQLGAIANIYHENFYGEMTDSINAGLPSDRLEVMWHLQEPRVKRLADRKSLKARDLTKLAPENFLLRESEDLCPTYTGTSRMSSEVYLAQVPSNISAIKQTSIEVASRWQVAIRAALRTAFSHGYTAQDFVEIDGAYFYVLVAPQAWFLYVLECADQTLYTGITPNLQQRLSLHNKGRGAAYTAARRPVKMVAAWQFETRQTAMRAERAFKKLSRTAKVHYLSSKALFADAPFFELGL